MKKINNILIPIDFSEASINAFKYGVQLADRLDAEVDVINVVFPEGASMDYPVLVAQASRMKIEAIRNKLKGFIKKNMTNLEPKLQNVPMIENDIEIGTPINGICAFAKRQGVDLIVMGSRGTNRSRLEKWLGSVSSGVVTQSTCPVMIIPKEVSYKDIESITYASNTNDADPFEIWKTLQLIKPLRPTINIVHINTHKEGSMIAWEKMTQMKTFFEEQRKYEVNTFHLRGKTVCEAMNQFSTRQATDLLIMYQGQHGFWDRLLFRSNTEEMADITKVPLLIRKTLETS